VLDFGIVKPAFPEAHDTTTTGMILGSAPYMSPEQVRGLPLTPASELWSLAAVFYSVLAGRPPFDGHNSADVVVRICSETPPPLSERTGLPSEYDRFFERAFARDGRLRWQTADEFLAALNSLPGSQARRESSAPLSPLQPRSRAGRDAETAPLERAPPALVPRHSRVRVAFAFLALGLLAFAGSALLREIKPAPQQSETTRREDSPPAHAEGAPSKLTSAAAEEAAPAPPPQSVSAPRAASSTRPPAPSHGAPVRGQPTPTPPSTDPIFGLPSAHP
jgi:serine/threonine-protein kinase